MKIVYIPASLYGALKAAQFSAADLKDVSKLLSTLSAEDVAFYFYCNQSKDNPIPEPIQATYPNLLEGIDLQEEAFEAVRTKLAGLKYNGRSSDIYETDSLLYSECIEEDLFILTHVVKSEDKAEISGGVEFYDRFLQQQLALQKLDDVVKSPVLLGWLEAVQTEA